MSVGANGQRATSRHGGSPLVRWFGSGRCLLAAASLLVILAAPAAFASSDASVQAPTVDVHRVRTGTPKPKVRTHLVPELDPSGIGAAAMLLAGSMLIARDRRKRVRQP